MPVHSPNGTPDAPATAYVHWVHDGLPKQAVWRSERQSRPPARVVLADDTTTADVAYQHACASTGLLWVGDFQNARQLLQAMARRCDTPPQRKKRSSKVAGHQAAPGTAEAFHLHRQSQAQRARVLGMLLMPIGADYGMALRRAPDMRRACEHAWGPPTPDTQPSVTSLRELLGLSSADEWRRVGVEVPALGAPPHNRIHPHYGVFSPVRGEYVDLVAQVPIPTAALQADGVAFDLGVGSGVLSALLARRGIAQVVGTDLSPRALDCARANLARLEVDRQVSLLQTDLFPPGRAALVVCNPPWLPARASSPIEQAVYDEGSRMLKGFLAGLANHLAPQGEGWLIMSDLAEHLGLRSRAELMEWFAGSGLAVLGRLDTRPKHSKATRSADALHAARAAEVTSLWRLGAVGR